MKLYKTLLATALLFVGAFFNNLSAQDFYDWGHQLGGTGNDNGKKITTDADGNVILVTEFSGTIDADPGAGITTLTAVGGIDVAVSKFDPNGNLIWAKSLGGTNNDAVTGVDTDSFGNVYVTGGYRGTVDFDPGVGVENRTSNGDLDIFLLKLDAIGDFQWVYNTGSLQSEVGKGVEVNYAGEVFLLGYFRNTVDFDPGLGTANLTSLGGADVFVLKLDTDGNYISVYHAGGTADEDPSGIAIDASNNVYLSGYFQGTTNFNVNGGTQNLTSAGANDLFVLKVNANNTFGWVKGIGSTGSDNGFDVTIDNNGDILIGGLFSGTVDFDPGVDTDIKTAVGGNDLLIVKLDADGNYIFGVSAGGVFDDQVWGISTDSDNNIFACGFVRGTVDFDPSAATQNLTVAGGGSFADQFYWKLDSDGNYLFAEVAGSTSNDHCFDIHVDGQALYTTGYFNGSIDLDITAGTDVVTAFGGSDVSFSKHINCTTVHTNDVIVSCGPVTWINGIEYTANNNIATETLTNVNGCDSIVHLNLIIKDIVDQTVTPSVSTLCDNGNVTVDLGTSQTGVFYSLVDQATMSVVDGPIEGNGSALTLDGGNISTTTTYEVQAERNKYNTLSFTGNSPTPTYVSLGNSMNQVFKGTNQVTAEAWINTSSTNSLQTVIGNYTDFGNTMQFLIRIDESGGSNKASFWIGTGPNPANYVSVAGTTTILTDTWYHVAGSYDGTTLSVYVNGVLENTVNISAFMPNINSEFRIGGGLSNNSEYFNGEITGVRVWNVARTQTEINDNKDVCIAGNETGLVAMYNMVDGLGSTVLSDESLNGYDGALMNMDENTSWSSADMPAVTCSMCNLTMTATPTVTVNVSTTGVDVQEHCDTYTWIDGVTYTASNNVATEVLVNSNGCDSIVTLDLTITTTPTATAVDNGDGTLSATGAGTYQWIDCATGNPVVGETSALFTPTADGSYAVIVTNGDCEDQSDCVNFTLVGLEENANKIFSAYPNPTNGVFTISSKNTLIASVVVHDAAGRLIVEKQNSSTTLSVDLSGMENGIYFVTIFDVENMQHTMKVVKK